MLLLQQPRLIRQPCLIQFNTLEALPPLLGKGAQLRTIEIDVMVLVDAGASCEFPAKCPTNHAPNSCQGRNCELNAQAWEVTMLASGTYVEIALKPVMTVSLVFDKPIRQPFRWPDHGPH